MWQFLKEKWFAIYMIIMMSLLLVLVIDIFYELGKKERIQREYDICIHICELEDHTPKELRKCKLECTSKKYRQLYNIKL